MIGLLAAVASVRPSSAPAGDPAICPHCWMVNPGPFELCARCGADMGTFLQESGGLRFTAPIQSPIPVDTARRLSLFQRGTMTCFLLMLAAAYFAIVFLPAAATSGQAVPAPPDPVHDRP